MKELLFSGELYVGDHRRKYGYRIESFKDLNVVQLYRKLSNTIVKQANIIKCPKSFKSERLYISTDLKKDIEDYILESISIREMFAEL